MSDTGEKPAQYLLGTRTLLNDRGKFRPGGWDPQGIWRQDMALKFVEAFGADPTQPLFEEGLAQLLAGRKIGTGEKWMRGKREIVAVDLQVAPHKSVTIAIILAESSAERAALLHAIRDANDYALRALAVRLGVARLGNGGSKGWIQGETSWVSFLHFTARPTSAAYNGPPGQSVITSKKVPCDPHIHFHNICFNAVYCNDGRLRALDLRQLRYIKEFGSIFQARLADLLRALGVRVRLDSTECAAVIDAVPDGLSNRFSKGHKSVESRARNFAYEQGIDWADLPVPRQWSIRRQAALRRISRQDGEGDVARWRSEAAAAGFHYKTCMTGERPPSLTREQRMEHGYGFVARRVAAAFGRGSLDGSHDPA